MGVFGNALIVAVIATLYFLNLISTGVTSGHIEPSKKFAQYGDSCDSKTTCNPISSLKCRKGICNCSRTDAMIFDNSTGKCFVMSGERCAPKTVSNKMQDPDFDDLVCVPNSNCSSDGYCTCNKNFFEASNGTCEPQRHFLEACDSSRQCLFDQRLHCIAGKCSCNQTLHLTFNVYNKKCATLAGHTPYDNNEVVCVPHATYDSWERKCKCDYNFKQTKDGLCTVPYDGVCGDSGSDCGHQMICKNGQCKCRFEGQSYTNEECVSKAGQPCIVETKENHILEQLSTPMNLTFPCTQNSRCLGRPDMPDLFECQCMEGFLIVNGECQLDYGEKCGSGANPKANSKCDESRNLQCIDNYCRCPEDKLQYFDMETKLCRGLVGASCKLCWKDDFCTDGAECKETSWQHGKASDREGVCNCNAGYKLNKNRNCSWIANAVKDETVVMTTTETSDNATTTSTYRDI